MKNNFPIERESFTQNFQFPSENEIIFENPPTLIWIPVKDAKDYTLTVYDGDEVFEKIQTSRNYANLSKVLECKTYSWTVESDTGLLREKMYFTVSDKAVLFERPTADEVFDSYPAQRPSYLFSKNDIEYFLNNRKNELSALKKNVEIALSRGLPSPPEFHKYPYSYDFKNYFSEHRLFCDRDLMACCIYYALTGDMKAGQKALDLLYCICGMSPLGPCAVDGDWDDETGISNIRCLPIAFDLLYDLLSDKQRRFVAQTIAVYAKQCENKLRKINYEQNPSHSHAGRVPAYLGGAALVLKGTGVVEDKTLKEWLSYALEIYCGIFPFYGGNDGSWAEGVFYSSSYTKWFLPFFAAVERFCKKSLFNRPFYHRYTEYLLHFANRDYENHPFCDCYWEKADSLAWPGFFAQNPFNIYADKFGPELARKRSAEYSKQDFYNLHVIDLFIPPLKVCENSLAEPAGNVAVFPDSGFIAMHTDIESSNDICVMARASRFTHDSHRHKDQGSFALFAGGVSLISPSGYYGIGYGTNHHFNWTKSTKAHNTLLIDGKGQETVPILDAVGKIISVDTDNKKCVLDMSSCYDGISLWQRTLELNECELIVSDRIEAQNDIEITYCLHSLSQPHFDGNCVKIERKGKKLNIIPCDNSLTLSEISDKFDIDVNDGQPTHLHVSEENQYHIYYKSQKAKVHTFIMKYSVEA